MKNTTAKQDALDHAQQIVIAYWLEAHRRYPDDAGIKAKLTQVQSATSRELLTDIEALDAVLQRASDYLRGKK